ncbi:MAG TPA: NfeD family protein [candidate division Zixibacteria bacterium]|nr:NfeD family protein [candidate division Zixibacteria bacterium]
MDWWLWILFGLLLLGAEIVTPGGFYIIFFGVGALVVGALAGFEAAGPLWFQFLLFSALSLCALWLFRGKLVEMARGESCGDVDTLVGETAVVTEEIPRNGVGKAELRGTSWSARNVGDGALARGARCRVERVEGLTIFVRGESR